MLRSVEFHPDAAIEAREARQWYAERSVIAARAFLSELSAVVQIVADSPERGPRYLAGTRRYFFPQFPFGLVYRVTEAKIFVIAVAHHRRKPGYWARRK